MGKRVQLGAVLAQARPSADTVCAWTFSQCHSAKQHHSAGAGKSSTTLQNPVHGPTSVGQHWKQDMTTLQEKKKKKHFNSFNFSAQISQALHRQTMITIILSSV